MEYLKKRGKKEPKIGGEKRSQKRGSRKEGLKALKIKA